MRGLVLVATLALAAPCAIAQRSSGSHFSPSGFTHAGFGHNRYARGTPHSFFDALGIFSDPYLSDALAQAYPASGQQPDFMMQNAPSPVSMPEQFSPPAQPLLIELRGDTYVRLSGPEGIPSETLRTGDARGKEIPPRPDSTRDSPRETTNANLTAANLAPVILVFRDGHRDQISDYTIADGILYTRGNYYTDGSWSKKIELSSLDLPETMKLNQSSTAQFRLPTAPNEIITRP
jgi:hypothetical protein